MPDTRITREKLKNHWAYSKKIYIFLTLVAVGLGSILYTVSNNRNPPDYKYAGIALVASYSNTDYLQNDIPKLLKLGQAYDENLEKLGFISITYSGGMESEMDYYGAQLYTVQLSAGDCDIFIQSPALAESLIVESEALIQLDTLPSFELFQKKYPDAIVWTDLNELKKEAAAEASDGEEAEGEAESEEAELHCYSIDVSKLLRLNEMSVYDVRGMYAGILSKSGNADTCLYLLYEMFNMYIPADTLPAVAPTATPAAEANR